MKKINKVGIMILIGMLIFIAGLLTSTTTYKQGQIDALKGKYEFKQVIHYEWIYNGYYPVDTIYVKNN